MSPEKQRIAVAKAHGWTNIKIIPLPAPNKKHSGEAGVSVCGARHPSWGFGSCSVPDYLNDRNAMHDAIITKFVTIELQQKFAMQLRSLIKKAPPFASRSWSDWDLIATSLPQLSEAFLCTLGLWEEDAQ